VSGVVDDYRFFNSEKKELIEEITGELDMYGLRKYRQDFSEPDEEMWKDAASERFGITVTGIHKIPTDEAKEQFNVDYSKSDVDPIFVPILEAPNGEEVIYDPDNFYDADDSTDDTSESETDETMDASQDEEPDFPADAETVQTYLEEQSLSDLTLQARATLAKLRDPRRTNDDIGDEVDCSKNTVRNGLQKFLGEDGYEDIKKRGREMRSNDTNDDYEGQMMTTDGGTTTDSDDGSEMVEVDAEAFAKLEGRIERLESMFDSEVLERV
jgi:hypothetical protein